MKNAMMSQTHDEIIGSISQERLARHQEAREEL